MCPHSRANTKKTSKNFLKNYKMQTKSIWFFLEGGGGFGRTTSILDNAQRRKLWPEQHFSRTSLKNNARDSILNTKKMCAHWQVSG